MKTINIKTSIDELYAITIKVLTGFPLTITPYIRRFIRFVSLPYCFFYLIDWDVCKIPKLRVIGDLLYIFFKLKYYPDNYSVCRLWEKDKSTWKYYYGSIYDPYQRKQLRKSVVKEENIVLFENKYICYQLCKSGGFPLPSTYSILYPEDNYVDYIINLFRDYPGIDYIIKPVDGRGGKGVALVHQQNGNIYVNKNDQDVMIGDFILNAPAVLQECIKQHSKLQEVSKSVNTVRLVSFYTKKGEVIFLGAYMRFGLGNSVVDNLCAGGVGVAVNINNGALSESMVDLHGNKYSNYDGLNIDLSNFQIPYWDAILKLGTDVQNHFFYHKLIGFDIAITERGPVIIELNAEPDIVALEMICGPLLANKIIWQEFNNHDLLINKPSRKLISWL